MKSRFNVCRFFYRQLPCCILVLAWRLSVSFLVIFTVSNFLFSSAFASYSAIEGKSTKSEVNFVNDHARSSYKYFNTQIGQLKKKTLSSQNKYQPYFELGGAKYFNQKSGAANIYDLFIPLFQKDNQLFFTDLRILDRSGSSFEGNAHIGYRKLYPTTKQMIGIYGAFDRGSSDNKNIFNQLTLGFEYWQNKLFIGSNIYMVVGKSIQSIKEVTIGEKKKTDEKNVTRLKLKDRYYEQAVSGVDVELGCMVIDNLTTYMGGYYFSSKDTDTVVGSRIRLIYDVKPTAKRILGVLDKISIEVGAQHDKLRSNTAYIGVKFKIGLSNFQKSSYIFGFESHMVDLIRRDMDIVVANKRTPERIEEIVETIPMRPQQSEEGILSENDTQQDVKNKFEACVKKNHPDKNSNKDIQKWYSCLKLYEKLKRRKNVNANPKANPILKPNSESSNSSGIIIKAFENHNILNRNLYPQVLFLDRLETGDGSAAVAIDNNRLNLQILIIEYSKTAVGFVKANIDSIQNVFDKQDDDLCLRIQDKDMPTLLEQLPNIILVSDLTITHNRSSDRQIYSVVNCKKDNLTSRQYGNIFSLYANGCNLYINADPEEITKLQGNAFSVNIRSSINGSNKDLKLVFDDIYPLIEENEKYSEYEMAYFSYIDSTSFFENKDGRRTGLCFLNSRLYSCWYDSKVYKGILEGGGHIDHDAIVKIFKIENDNGSMTIKRFAVARQIYDKSSMLFNEWNLGIKKIGLFERVVGTIENILNFNFKNFGHYETPNSAIVMNVLEHVFYGTSRWSFISAYIRNFYEEPLSRLWYIYLNRLSWQELTDRIIEQLAIPGIINRLYDAKNENGDIIYYANVIFGYSLDTITQVSMLGMAPIEFMLLPLSLWIYPDLTKDLPNLFWKSLAYEKYDNRMNHLLKDYSVLISLTYTTSTESNNIASLQQDFATIQQPRDISLDSYSAIEYPINNVLDCIDKAYSSDDLLFGVGSPINNLDKYLSYDQMPLTPSKHNGYEDNLESLLFDINSFDPDLLKYSELDYLLGFTSCVFR
ncbi:hypothetical protein GAMM_30050 [Gammaproteobacteria bacterium]